jgi:hypothetical protein
VHGPIVSPARDLYTSTVNEYSLYHKNTIQEIKAHCPDTIHLFPALWGSPMPERAVTPVAAS